MFIDPPDMISTPEVISDLIDDRITIIDAMVTTANATAVTALTALQSQTYEVDWEQPTLDSVTSGLDGINPEEPTTPTLAAIASSAVTFAGTTPLFTPVVVANDAVPEFVEKDYGFAIPEPPVVTWPVLTASVPGLSDIPIPTPPDYELPAVPTIDDIVIPAPPEYAVDEFTGVMPTDDLTAPVIAFNWAEDAFSSDIYDRLNAMLRDRLVAGGSGLDEATEQAIYDRATSRMEEEEQALLDQVDDGHAARGFVLPPGAHNSSVLEAENKVLRTRTDLSNDILVNQSKLAQENTHFTISKSVEWQNILVNYHSQAQSRGLEAEKQVALIAVQMHSAKIETYKAKIQGYAILAEAYKTRIQGEAVKAEFYKAQMQGVMAHAEVKQALVQAYVAQVNSVHVLMQAYKVEMEGAQIRANIDKTKIDAFVAEVQAYMAQVQASTARYEGYKAQIQGEVSKTDMARADAQTYAARVEGYKSKAQVDIARAEANLTNTKGEVAVFTSLIDKYKADVQQSIMNADVLIKQQGLDIDLFKTGTMKYTSELDALVRNYLGHVEHAKAQADLEIKSADVGVRATLGAYELSVEAAKGVARVAGSMVAGLGSAVNASVNANSSDSRSDMRSWNGNMSSASNSSENVSVMTQHIYQHEV